jgi:TonB family protein
MQSSHSRPESGRRYRNEAYEGLKRRWNRIVFGSILSAVVFHAGVLHLWPRTEVSGVFKKTNAPTHLLSVATLASYELPPPPGAIPVTSLPAVESPVFQLEDLAVEEMDGLLPEFFERVAIDFRLPRTQVENAAFARFVHFAPSMVRPRIANMGDVERFLRRHYRPILERTGITGEVKVNFWIDEDGSVQRADIMVTSGSMALDRLAMELSGIVRFTPARTRNIPVAVQVAIPIVFETT